MHRRAWPRRWPDACPSSSTAAFAEDRLVKALALGAAAVLVGRPYLYALGVGGADGVSRMIGILRSEFEMAMALTGYPTVRSIGRSVLWPH